ncbi:hypothetical protein VE01_07737 [Pseudogymnoascus verrucosus]|uniref:DNA 3'-5' helicase n=1 Tax=Pseudogymnoascus verrucosus TaxID=342668 RepID=A0A1B8GEW6_9PEZI|nr:uncharacterized protein VE01_07737 [Pseudogymnoascus verrucosus]OBT94379.1 hypothetical protein VE01_07737 [Pseudogymnoascus verrucosus]
MVVYCNNKVDGEKGWKSPTIEMVSDPNFEIRDQVIVATNALGLGIDVPDIRVVIHVEVVWRLKDYGQESGQAGRDGQSSEAIIIMPKRSGQPSEVARKNVNGWINI